jgi:cobaltochelatase CobS
MADTNAEWLQSVVKTLTAPGLLSLADRSHVNRHLELMTGYGIESIADAPLEWTAKRGFLDNVMSAVINNKVATLPLVPEGRINPLAPVVVIPPVAPSVIPPATEAVDPMKAAQSILQAFADIAKGVTPAATPALDEERVKALAAEVTDAVLAAKLAEILATIEAANKGTPQRIEISLNGGTKVIDLGTEPRHWQFMQVLAWLEANCPVWLWGKAGSGKTHMARQLAKALDLPVTIISIDPTMTVGKLVGFRSLANGEFVEGFLLKPFRDGGLVMLDEIDTGDPGILACLNALIANGHYTFPDGQCIERHANFRIIAGANTKGTGAVAGYTARQRLDAATLNRFAIIELEYDERLEEVLAVGDSELPAKVWTKAVYPDIDTRCRGWVRWVQKVRRNVGNSVLISPRATYLGVAALRSGVPAAEVADALVFSLVTSDTKTSITQSVGRFS